MKSLRVLHLVKWYPNREDKQNGEFVRKHVRSTTPWTESAVLFFKETTLSSNQPEIEKSTQAEVDETIVYHQPLGKLAAFSFKKKMIGEFIAEWGKPDLLHLHLLAPDQYLGMNVARKLGIPYVITEHWSGYPDGRYGNLSFLRRKLYSRMIQRARFVFPVSEFLKMGMIACGLKGHYRVVNNVVEPPESNAERHKVFTFVVVSDLVDDNKNISGTIEAFNRIKSEGSTAELVLIGDGPDRDQILKKISESPFSGSIQYKGRLQNIEVLDSMQRCHCLVVNSRIETFSVVTLEARALGLHVISTRCGGPEELVDEYVLWTWEENGLSVNMTHVQKLPAPPYMDVQKFSAQFIGEQLVKYYRKAL